MDRRCGSVGPNGIRCPSYAGHSKHHNAWASSAFEDVVCWEDGKEPHLFAKYLDFLDHWTSL